MDIQILRTCLHTSSNIQCNIFVKSPLLYRPEVVKIVLKLDQNKLILASVRGARSNESALPSNLSSSLDDQS
jgi:hypothetical protein